MTTEEIKVVKKLAKEFGADKTLKELLKMKDNTPIEDVKITLVGVYRYAYELTGEIRTWCGTIKDIIAEFYDEYIDDEDSSDLVRLDTLLTEEQLEDFTKLFFGERNDRCVDYIRVTHSREITHKEVKEYLSSILVSKDFDYMDTFKDF